MNTLEELEKRLRNESPAFCWRCNCGMNDAEMIEINATTSQGRQVPHTPFFLNSGMVDRLGMDSAVWLICHELSPNRAGVDWDRLAEI